MTKNNNAAGLCLLVIRSSDLERDAKFYAALGFEFSKHQHGSGPEHFAAESDGLVFEIYPLQNSKPQTTGVRIGFAVDSVDQTVEELVGLGAKVVSEPKDSQWGRRAVLDDLEGHRIEIVAR